MHVCSCVCLSMRADDKRGGPVVRCPRAQTWSKQSLSECRYTNSQPVHTWHGSETGAWHREGGSGWASEIRQHHSALNQGYVGVRWLQRALTPVWKSKQEKSRFTESHPTWREWWRQPAAILKRPQVLTVLAFKGRQVTSPACQAFVEHWIIRMHSHFELSMPAFYQGFLFFSPFETHPALILSHCMWVCLRHGFRLFQHSKTVHGKNSKGGKESSGKFTLLCLGC